MKHPPGCSSSRSQLQQMNYWSFIQFVSFFCCQPLLLQGWININCQVKRVLWGVSHSGPTNKTISIDYIFIRFKICVNQGSAAGCWVIARDWSVKNMCLLHYFINMKNKKVTYSWKQMSENRQLRLAMSAWILSNIPDKTKLIFVYHIWY